MIKLMCFQLKPIWAQLKRIAWTSTIFSWTRTIKHTNSRRTPWPDCVCTLADLSCLSTIFINVFNKNWWFLVIVYVDMGRSTIALFIVSFFVMFIAFWTGVAGCWRRSPGNITATAILVLLACKWLLRNM